MTIFYIDSHNREENNQHFAEDYVRIYLADPRNIVLACIAEQEEVSVLRGACSDSLNPSKGSHGSLGTHSPYTNPHSLAVKVWSPGFCLDS